MIDGSQADDKMKETTKINKSMYILCLSKFCVGPIMTPWKVYAQNYKNVCPKVLIFENARTNIIKSANFFVCYCFKFYKEKMLTDRADQLKVEIDDGREAP